jgi:hypothetical protein
LATLDNIADAQEQGNQQVSFSKNNKFAMFHGERELLENITLSDFKFYGIINNFKL